MGHPWKRKTDLSGNRFGRLLVVSEAARRGQRGTREHWRRWWLCRCDCGTACTISMDNLSSGDTTSCGCLQRELLGDRRRIHGRRHTTEYTIWANMKKRCTNPNDTHYDDYGGRGISVCARWMKSFAHFYEDMGPRPRNKSLDRRDNNGHYSKENCRWATAHEQRVNSRPKRTHV